MLQVLLFVICRRATFDRLTLDNPRLTYSQMCANDSRSLPDQTLNFIKSHPLMDHPVSAAGQQPIIVQAGFRSAHQRFSLFIVVYNVTRSDKSRMASQLIGTSLSAAILRSDKKILRINIDRAGRRCRQYPGDCMIGRTSKTNGQQCQLCQLGHVS